MSYSVEIVADSVGPNHARLTTFQLRYPRMVHAELMTHRMFSRNASSTRAIPTSKMLEWIEKDPAMPVYWGKNQRGMQATEEMDGSEIAKAKAAWLDGRDDAVTCATKLMKLGIHKQIASRVLEPWAHINVIVSATDFYNFFTLRCDKNAMPEIQVLAVRMARAYRDSVPVKRPASLCDGNQAWHLPFVTDEERGTFNIDKCKLLSVARCARVSYLTFEGQKPDPQRDFDLAHMLESNGHWSPFEHPARASAYNFHSGNFIGWDQYRQELPKGVHEEFDFSLLDQFEGRDFIV